MGRILDDAISYATKMHSGAFRKGTRLPYIVHPMEAASIAASMTDDEEILAAAVLHDTVEDTEATREDIEQLFGPRVAEFVASESENKMEDRPAGETWKERKQATIDKLKDASAEEQILVLADKLSNIRAMYRDHLKLGDQLWDRFNQKDKQMHAWYYRSVAEGLGKVKGTVAFAEYVELVEKTFS